MDTKNEDKIVRQIEKSLSNNMNENLFLTGSVFGNNKTMEPSSTAIVAKDEKKDKEIENSDYPLISYDYTSESPTTMSRAEYIRQAREACLRQLSNTQVYSRAYDVNYMEAEAVVSEQMNQINTKKEKTLKLFQEDTGTKPTVQDSPQEIASFRSLIIRTVCAVVLFITVFIFDKFELSIGNLTHNIIQEYVTGNDTLQQLENIIVTWLK